jgi:hypothetical protein
MEVEKKTIEQMKQAIMEFDTDIYACLRGYLYWVKDRLTAYPDLSFSDDCEFFLKTLEDMMGILERCKELTLMIKKRRENKEFIEENQHGA